MGNVFFAKIYRVKDLAQTIENLKVKGYNIFAAANEADSLDYKRDIKINSKDLGIIIGNEGHGIEDKIKEASTATIKIPVINSVEHLNAAAAGAILMSHFSPY